MALTYIILGTLVFALTAMKTSTDVLPGLFTPRSRKKATQ